MIQIRRIDKEHEKDIRLPNEPFALTGYMIPRFDGSAWSYEVRHRPEWEIERVTFPDENYQYDAMAKNSFFVGAYDEEECVGLAIYQRSWNRYLYLYDLKVNQAVRRKMVGKMLIEEGRKIALENGYKGIYTQGQDNNLNACLFYVSSGFQIGGLDTKVYEGTKQEGKSDILFYLECVEESE